jgi:hypothetical protein
MHSWLHKYCASVFPCPTPKSRVLFLGFFRIGKKKKKKNSRKFFIFHFSNTNITRYTSYFGNSFCIQQLNCNFYHIFSRSRFVSILIFCEIHWWKNRKTHFFNSLISISTGKLYDSDNFFYSNIGEVAIECLFSEFLVMIISPAWENRIQNLRFWVFHFFFFFFFFRETFFIRKTF